MDKQTELGYRVASLQKLICLSLISTILSLQCELTQKGIINQGLKTSLLKSKCLLFVKKRLISLKYYQINPFHFSKINLQPLHKSFYPCGGDPVPTFNWVFEYQPIVLEILTQPRRYKRAESNFLEHPKRVSTTWTSQLSGFYIILYLYIYLPTRKLNPAGPYTLS